MYWPISLLVSLPACVLACFLFMLVACFFGCLLECWLGKQGLFYCLNASLLGTRLGWLEASLIGGLIVSLLAC